MRYEFLVIKGNFHQWYITAYNVSDMRDIVVNKDFIECMRVDDNRKTNISTKFIVEFRVAY